MSRKKDKQVFTYQCTITNESFKTTRQAPNVNELVSVDGYYELHSEDDDRPETVKIKRVQAREERAQLLAALAGAKNNNEG